jgi:hypothetical protein
VQLAIDPSGSFIDAPQTGTNNDISGFQISPLSPLHDFDDGITTPSGKQPFSLFPSLLLSPLLLLGHQCQPRRQRGNRCGSQTWLFMNSKLQAIGQNRHERCKHCIHD